MTRGVAAAGLILCALGSPAPVAAQSACDAPREGLGIVELIDLGYRQRVAGCDAAALATFETALEREQSSEVLAQVALAEQALGRWAAAEGHFERALALDDAFVTEHRAVLQQALATVREHVATVAVVGPPTGATLRLDGRSVGVFPVDPLRVEEGTHRLEASLDGQGEVSESFTVRGGERRSVVLEMGATDEAAPEPARRSPDLVIAGAVTGGVGLVAAGVGVGLLVERERIAARSQECLELGDTGCVLEQREAHGAVAESGVALTVVGAALVGVGVVLLLVDALSEDGGGGSAVACLPTPVGVACAGRL